MNDDRLNRIKSSIDALLAELKRGFAQTDLRLGSVEERLGSVEERLASVEAVVGDVLETVNHLSAERANLNAISTTRRA